jgi:hypothetical protein
MKKSRFSFQNHQHIGTQIHNAYRMMLETERLFDRTLERSAKQTLLVRRVVSLLLRLKALGDNELTRDFPEYPGTSPYYENFHASKKCSGLGRQQTKVVGLPP